MLIVPGRHDDLPASPAEEVERTRIRADDAFLHRTRERVRSVLRDHPGLSRGELAAALGVDPLTLVHHLEVLQALGLVSARREGREVLYAIGRVPREERPLRAPARRALARLLAAAPRTQGELAASTGLSQRLVAYHLARLGPLVASDGGRPRRYWLVATVRS